MISGLDNTDGFDVHKYFYNGINFIVNMQFICIGLIVLLAVGNTPKKVVI